MVALKRIFSVLLISIVSMSVLSQTNGRPKIGVVLSGGGAKGAAHVKALKVIEEAGIPIDLVVGTSMGSLVGGLYAAGYTTDDLDSILTQQNWKNLLMNLTSRNNKQMNMKMNTDRYTFSVFFEKHPEEIVNGGVLKGEQVGKLLSDLTSGLHKKMDYRRLPIPFACVATDITTGNEIDIQSGVLAESMRASMAIPGVFSPVRLDSMVLVDGGMVNNYPVDLARRMGADIVIGVDLASGSRNADQIKTVFDVLAQTLDVICKNKYEENVANTDIYIKVDVSGYSSASFNNKDIDSLMMRGEQAARRKWGDLISLRKDLENKYGTINIKPRNGYKYVAQPNEQPVQSIIPENKRTNMLGVGIRFDNEELASVLLGGSYLFYKERDLRALAEFRLGKRLYGKAAFQFRPFEKFTWTSSYSIGKNETKVYNRGQRAATFDYSEHNIESYLSRSWMQVMVDLGMRYNVKNFSDVMVTKAQRDEDWTILNGTRTLDLFLKFSFDNQDDTFFPTKGIRWNMDYTVTPYGKILGTIDNKVLGYDFDRWDHAFMGSWEIAIPIKKKFVLQPSVSGRYISANEINPANYNFIGGVGTYGHYLPQQLAFAGIDYMETTGNAIVIGALKGRYNIWKKHYINGVVNYGHAWSITEDSPDTPDMIGWALGYSYRSIIGPISAHIDWSNRTKKVGFFINVGYMF